MTENVNLFDTVVEGGYCIGCGACAVSQPDSISMELDKHGKFQAIMTGDMDEQADNRPEDVCPFLVSGGNEDDIASRLFAGLPYNSKGIGYYNALYAGHVKEGDYHRLGSSGGMVSWLLCELLENNLIDGILHVGSSDQSGDQRLFKYQISRTADDVRASAKSRYYPVELSEIFQIVKRIPGRYALVGLPCFIKSARLLMKQNLIFKERIVYSIALVCGHLKSTEYARMLGWQIGIHPNNIKSIDFRKKNKGQLASEYGVEVKGTINNVLVTKHVQNNQLYGTDWGMGLFKYKACDFCDDLLGETADVTIGDAWVQPYLKDDRGNNIIIIRDQKIRTLFEEGELSIRLQLDKVSPRKIIRSQKGGLFHKREGLAYRLFLKDVSNIWRPTKRVRPNGSHLSKRLKRKHYLRSELRTVSHTAFQKSLENNSIIDFYESIAPIEAAYRAVEKSRWKIIAKGAQARIAIIFSLLNGKLRTMFYKTH